MQIKFSEGMDTHGFRQVGQTHTRQSELQRTDAYPRQGESKKAGNLKQNGGIGRIDEADSFSGAYFDRNVISGGRGNGQLQREIKKASLGCTSEADVTNLSNYMTVVSNTVSDEDYHRMLKEGFDPGDIEPVTGEGVLGAIKAAVLKGGSAVAGFNTDISPEEAEEIAGSRQAAEAIIRAAERYDVPLTSENVKESAEAISKASELRPLEAGEAVSMVLDGESSSVGSLYMAESSGNAIRPVDEDIEAAGLDSEIERAVKGAEGEYSETISFDEAVSYAKEMVSYGVPLTNESMKDYIDLRTLVLPPDMQVAANAAMAAISDGKPALTGDLTDTRNSVMKADELLHNEAVSARIRAQMSADTNLILIKSGFSIDTKDIEALADALEQAESRRLSALWGSDNDAAAEKDGIYKNTLEAVETIRNAPAVLAAALPESVFSVGEAGERARNITDSFKRMNETYEAVGTQVRTDLGDSMAKAFSNVGEILESIGLEDNTANERAVRILGWNSTEITKESVLRVRQTDDMLNLLVNKMTPAACLSLVRDGVDTLNTDVQGLLRMIEDKETERGADYDSLGEFVYRMESAGKLTDDERESLIGIFRLLNQVKKHDDRSVGGLLNSGREFTLGNLFTESKSLRVENKIDISMGQDYQGRDHETRNSIIDQIVSHQKAVAEELTEMATPGSLMSTGLDRISDMSPDELLDSVKTLSGLWRDEEKMENETLDHVAEHAALTGDEGASSALERESRADKTWEEKIVSDMRETLTQKTVEELFSRELASFGGTPTINSVLALKTLRTDRSGYLKKAYEKDEGVKPDTEGFISAFTGSEEAMDASDRLCAELEDRLDQRLASDEGISYLDIQALKAARKQVSVIRQLSREEDYEVPVDLNGTLTSVNIKLIHGEQKGRVYASMAPWDGAEVSSSFSISEGIVSGYVVCAGSGLKERIETVKSGILDGFSGDIEIIESDAADPGRFDLKAAEEKKSDGSGVPTAELYRLARNFLTAISGLEL